MLKGYGSALMNHAKTNEKSGYFLKIFISSYYKYLRLLIPRKRLRFFHGAEKDKFCSPH
jgi:hypothetical protein